MGIFSWMRKKSGAAAAGDIDPGLMYCPQCHGEYRAGIVRCAACEVELVSGAERLARRGGGGRRAVRGTEAITAADALISLRRGQLKDLKYYRKLLADAGIPSIIAGEAAGCRTG